MTVNEMYDALISIWTLKCAIPSVVSFKVANTDVYSILQSTKDMLIYCNLFYFHMKMMARNGFSLFLEILI